MKALEPPGRPRPTHSDAGTEPEQDARLREGVSPTPAPQSVDQREIQRQLQEVRGMLFKALAAGSDGWMKAQKLEENQEQAARRPRRRSGHRDAEKIKANCRRQVEAR